VSVDAVEDCDERVLFEKDLAASGWLPGWNTVTADSPPGVKEGGKCKVEMGIAGLFGRSLVN
jgi:hypothetical protein